MPTAYTILFLLLILVAAATWIIPAGSYDYVDGVPVSGTYHPVEQNPQGVGDVLKAAFSGFYDAVDVCIFILMVGGFLGVVMKTGAVDAGVSNIIRLLGGREKWLIPILMLLFGLGGTTYGMWEETMAFYPLLIPVFLAAGYDAVGRKYNVPLYDLKGDKTRRVDTPLRPMDICCRALDAGYLINLPVLKGHCQTRMTCALKNCKGCLPDREKRRFHAEGLMEPIAALAAALRPALTIVDSICGDLDFEEGGNPVPTGRMLLGTDMVQLDAYGCRLMGLEPAQVPYIGLAEGWGAGSAALAEGDIVRLNTPADGAEYPAPSGTVAALTRSVQAKSACSACYASLVRALYRRGGGKRAVAIGQGWKGVPFDGLGIGACCDCAREQVKGCPPSPEDILRAL